MIKGLSPQNFRKKPKFPFDFYLLLTFTLFLNFIYYLLFTLLYSGENIFVKFTNALYYNLLNSGIEGYC
jgi:hypothetical protein